LLFSHFGNAAILAKWLAICPLCQSWHFGQIPAKRHLWQATKEPTIMKPGMQEKSNKQLKLLIKQPLGFMVSL